MRDQAKLALAAFRRVQRNDVVTLLQRRHARPYVHHNTGAFMAQDGGEDAFGIGTAECVVVGMANAGGLDLHQHFAKLGALQIDRFDGEGAACFPGDGCFCFHA